MKITYHVTLSLGQEVIKLRTTEKQKAVAILGRVNTRNLLINRPPEVHPGQSDELCLVVAAARRPRV